MSSRDNPKLREIVERNFVCDYGCEDYVTDRGHIVECHARRRDEAYAALDEVLAPLRELVMIPALRQVLGDEHTDHCKCALCRCRELLKP